MIFFSTYMPVKPHFSNLHYQRHKLVHLHPLKYRPNLCCQADTVNCLNRRTHHQPKFLQIYDHQVEVKSVLNCHPMAACLVFNTIRVS